MANRNFQQFAGTMERAVVKLYLKATFATGVATIVEGAGIKSFAKTATGDYLITFGTSAPAKVDKYSRLLGVNATFISAGGLPAAPFCAVDVDSVASAGTLGITFSDGDTPAATDPADADTLLLEVTLLNTGAY